MKGLFVVAALALAAVVCAELEYELVPPTYPCVWSVEVETMKLLSHKKNKFLFNSYFVRIQEINHQGTVLSDLIYRPDITFTNNRTNMTYITVFNYTADACTYTDEDALDINEIEFYKNNTLRLILGYDIFSRLIDPVNYTNKSSVERDGIECDVYYDIDLDSEAVYVDKSNGYIMSIVINNDIPDQRTEYKFKYGTSALYKEFAFDKDYVYNCSNNAILDPPEEGYFTCAASALKAAIAAMLLSLLVALF